jgi:hypothetical protein
MQVIYQRNQAEMTSIQVKSLRKFSKSLKNRNLLAKNMMKKSVIFLVEIFTDTFLL